MSSRRRPIEYKAQFVPGVFRPPEEVENERDLVEEDAPPVASSVTPLNTRRSREEKGDSAARSSLGRTNERLSERSNERTHTPDTEPRRRVRHSFDIWEDQLLALTYIQAQDFLTTRRKPKLGELVQEALDTYISSRRGTNGRMNVRTNEGTNRRQ